MTMYVKGPASLQATRTYSAPWNGPKLNLRLLCVEPNRRRSAAQRKRWQDAKAKWEAQFVAHRRAERWQARDWYPGRLKGERSVRDMVLATLSPARWMT